MGAPVVVVKESLATLINAGVTDLSGVNSTTPLTEDGLPPDWIADLVNYSTEELQEIADSIPDTSPNWALALRDRMRGTT